MIAVGSVASRTTRRVVRGGVALVASSLLVTGCVAPSDGFVETLPAPDPGIETPPAPDPEPTAEEGDEVVFDSTQECLEGNWMLDNDKYAAFYVGYREGVSFVSASGLATFTVDDEKYRMFFDDWEIRYTDAGDQRIEVRNGSETVIYDLVPIDTIVVAEREEEIDLGVFSLVGGDGDPVALASSEQAFLPLDDAFLRCTASTLDAVTDFGTFSFGRL